MRRRIRFWFAAEVVEHARLSMDSAAKRNGPPSYRIVTSYPCRPAIAAAGPLGRGSDRKQASRRQLHLPGSGQGPITVPLRICPFREGVDRLRAVIFLSQHGPDYPCTVWAKIGLDFAAGFLQGLLHGSPDISRDGRFDQQTGRRAVSQRAGP